jgi:hypothetical protein
MVKQAIVDGLGIAVLPDYMSLELILNDCGEISVLSKEYLNYIYPCHPKIKENC